VIRAPNFPNVQYFKTHKK